MKQVRKSVSLPGFPPARPVEAVSPATAATRPQRRPGHVLWLLVAILVSPGAVAQDPDALADLKALMGCTAPPEPTGVLLALRQSGTIASAVGPGFDDEYCWALDPAISWDGLQFSALCAVSGDPAIIARHAGLYWQGPTHPPFAEVWLLTTRPVAEIRAWAGRALPPGSRFEIDPDGDGSGRNALSCSEWRFPLPAD